jgi:hypothetical protein
MKKLIFGISLILVVSLAGLAQKQVSKNTKINGSGSGSASRNDNTGNLAVGTAVDAQLQQTLDVKKARVGDQVLLKVVRSVKQNGQTIIPKGANLVGRVTEVQQKTKDNAVSKLGVVFDKIQGQNLNMPVTATILSVTNATANVGAGDMLNSDISGTSSSSGGVSRQSSGGSSGGGLLGGVTGTAGGIVGTTTGAVGNSAGGVATTARDTVGAVAGATRQTVGSTAQTLGQTVRGLQITPSIGADGSANGATTLSAADKNVRVEKGANFQLRLSGN